MCGFVGEAGWPDGVLGCVPCVWICGRGETERVRNESERGES